VPRGVSASLSAPVTATSPLPAHSTLTDAPQIPPNVNTNGKTPYDKEHKLLKHADYDRVYKQGRRHFSPLMTFFYLESASADHPRVGITVGRALGGAVVRNRIKRRMREAVRTHLPSLCAPPAPAVDVVINPKKVAHTAEFTALLQEVERGFAQVRKQLAIAAAQRRSRS
jgi:ribonuclease P protein component